MGIRNSRVNPIIIDDLEKDYITASSFHQEMIYKMAESLRSELEKVFIRGLERKGYTFNSEQELEDFVKANCRSVTSLSPKEKVYYVNEVPFLLHEMNTKVVTDPRITGDPNKVFGELGRYCFL